MALPQTNKTITAEFVTGLCLGLVPWGLGLMGINLNVWFGAAILLVAYALISYSLLSWAQKFHFAWRLIIVSALGALLFLVAGWQLIGQYYLAHPNDRVIDLQFSPRWLPAPLLLAIVLVASALLWYSRRTKGTQQNAEQETVGTLVEVNTKTRRELEEEIASVRSQLDEWQKYKLTFEIDGKQSQVHMSGGTEVRRIQANIKLRCLKSDPSVMAVREFHASLHKETSTGEETIIPVEGAIIVMAHPSMQMVTIDDGWAINQPITPYRWYQFFLELTPKLEAQLSREDFLRVTMFAVGQDPQSIDFYVDSWVDARQSNSDITLKEKPNVLITDGKTDFICGDRWLHSIAEQEKTAIQVRFKVTSCNVWKTSFGEEPREIEFNFDLLNCSVYPIALVGEIGSTSRIVFAHKTLLYPPSMMASANQYLHGNSGWFHLTQQLTEGEYSRISNASQDCTFEFQKLNIEIKGGKGFENTVTPTTLKIPYMVTLSNNLYPARH